MTRRRGSILVRTVDCGELLLRWSSMNSSGTLVGGMGGGKRESHVISCGLAHVTSHGVVHHARQFYPSREVLEGITLNCVELSHDLI